ncbi:MAG: hypothetical protein KBC95_00270 [Candidatus Peribacteraceae bacterium]|nr:hypothetical protein [Candidatus Peribacteraceae bacterium]
MSPRNEHHGLPRSHGGSSHSTNLTTVDEQRHNDWHGIVGHPTPDGLIRHLLLVRATRLRLSLPPSVVEDGLSILKPNDLAGIYESKALLIPSQRADGLRNATRHRIHRWSHMSEELRLADRVVGSLSGSTDLSQDAARISDAFQGFFQTVDPAEHIRQILLEHDQHNGQIAWSKPILPGVRSDLLDVLKGAKAERQGEAQQRRLLDIVFGHLDAVERQRHRLKPSLDDLQDYQQWRHEVQRRRAESIDSCGQRQA